jgi:hypothetical protein
MSDKKHHRLRGVRITGAGSLEALSRVERVQAPDRRKSVTYFHLLLKSGQEPIEWRTS